MEFLNTENPGVLILLVMLSLGLVRIIERLIQQGWARKKNGKKSIPPAPANPGCTGLTKEEHKMLEDLHDMHDIRDDDGIPLWYVPRSLIATMVKQTEILDKLAVRARDIKQSQYEIKRILSEEYTGRVDVPPRR